MFLMNGVAFAGQMLVPVFLIKGCGLSPSETGWLMAPLGLGMMCTYPLMGKLTDHFGIRRVAASGALLATVATLPFLYLASFGLNHIVLMAALFLRGAGMSAIGIPSITSAYAPMARKDLPMATSAMNIVQRLGGPTLTTTVASFLGWRLAAAHESNLASVFTGPFGLLCVLHFVLFLAALRLPLLVERRRRDVG
jgi:MFS family permease